MSIPKTPYHDAARGLKGSLGGSFNATGITLVDANAPAVNIAMDADSVAAADRVEGRLYLQNLIQRANSGDVDAARIVANRSTAAAERIETDKKERERFWQGFINGQLQDLRDRLKAINLDIAHIDERISAFEKRLAEIREEREAIARGNAYYLESGEYELDADGKLSDRKQEQALQAYERETGKKVDRNEFHAVYEALWIQNQEDEREKSEIEKGIEELNKEKKELTEEADAIKDAQQETDPDKKQQKVDQLKPRQQYDVAFDTLRDGGSSEIAQHVGVKTESIDDDLSAWNISLPTSKPEFNRTAPPQKAGVEPEVVQTARSAEINPVNKPPGMA